MFVVDNGEGRRGAGSAPCEGREEHELHRVFILPRAGFGLDVPFSGMDTKELGRAGESLVCRFLEATGLEVVERNWACPAGEADIVASGEDGTVVFVEVKTRRVGRFDDDVVPELLVGEAKQARYLAIARDYLSRSEDVPLVRFDVAGVSVKDGADARLHYINGAFWGDC